MSHPWQMQAASRISSLVSNPLQPNMLQQQQQQQQQVPQYQQQQQQQPVYQQPFAIQQQQQQQQVYQQPLSMQQQNQLSGGLISQQMQLEKNKSYTTVTYPFQSASLSSLGSSNLPVHAAMQNSLAVSSQGAITYPSPRTARSFTTQPPLIPSVPPPSVASNGGGGDSNLGIGLTPKTRVFTGTITKLYDNFGFVDGDVFFQTSVCTAGLPAKVGERALVDASYNANMPFKWNATRVQVLPTEMPRQSMSSQDYDYNYSAVPPPAFGAGGGAGNYGNGTGGGGGGGGGGEARSRGSRRRDRGGGRDKERDPERDAERDAEREKRREERLREREKEREKEKEKRSRSPSTRRRSKSPRRASRSPPRRRARVVPRYVVQVPKIALDMSEANLLELKRRYTNMYIPSDFFTTLVRWVDAFPANRPLTLDRPCAFHVMHKEVEPVVENNAVLEPADADFTFSAKVMLLSVPGLEEVFRKSCALAEEMQDGEMRDGFVHPTRLINFLVGSRGKNETMAIGGPWSPSLDGPNPDADPSVLIRTAVRTCKALTGIDLSSCTQWYRFVEMYYHRGERTHKGKAVGPRVETVVLFLPDVWSCVPTRLEWDGLQHNYEKQLTRKLSTEQEAGGSSGGTAAANGAATASADDQKAEKSDAKMEVKLEPKLFSELDPKTMKVAELRRELDCRSLSSKGLTSQLVARLAKALKTEQEAAAEAAQAGEEAQAAATPAPEPMEVDNVAAEKKKRELEEKQKKEERERQARERRFALPAAPHIVVHPSRTAKAGKFDCSVMSLSLLLDYRAEDTKEHSFEVSLFAELFNEMLMRDFGFRIYRALVDAPEKPKEEEKEKSKEKSVKKERESSSSSKDKDAKEKDSKDKDSKDKDSKDKDSKEKEVKEEKKDKPEEKKEAEPDREKDEDQEDEVEEIGEESNASNDGSKKKDSKEKKEKVKMVTADPSLLLAFLYFDQSHCGYILDKDIEEILATLGLNLSRAQCRKLLQKVVTRDSLHYRKLTDRPVSEVAAKEEAAEPGIEARHQEELAAGNRTLLPVFQSACVPPARPCRTAQLQGAAPETQAVSDNGVVTFRGSVVDLSKLLQQLERSEKSRIDTEDKIASLQNQLIRTKDLCSDTAASATKLTSELRDCRTKLEETEEGLKIAEENGNLFLEALGKVQEVVEPILAMHAPPEVRAKLLNYDEKREEAGEAETKMELEDVTSVAKDDIKEETAEVKQESV